MAGNDHLQTLLSLPKKRERGYPGVRWVRRSEAAFAVGNCHWYIWVPKGERGKGVKRDSPALSGWVAAFIPLAIGHLVPLKERHCGICGFNSSLAHHQSPA